MSIPVGLLLAITVLLTLCVVAVVACITIATRSNSRFHLIAEKASEALSQSCHNRRQIDELQRRALSLEGRLSNFHKGLNSTNERVAEAFDVIEAFDKRLASIQAQLSEPKPDPHVDTLNHFEHRLNALHNDLTRLAS